MTTLFAALNVLEGTVIGSCAERHRHTEFLAFLGRIERETPKGRAIHMILDNYGTHTHPKVTECLGKSGDIYLATGGDFYLAIDTAALSHPFLRRVAQASSVAAHRAGIAAALTNRVSDARFESVNTEIRLITRAALRLPLADALIAVALLTLGGYRQPLPGRSS